MKDRTFISDLSTRVGQTVRLCGWVEVVRDQKSIQFVILRDPTGLVQLTHKREADEALADAVSALSIESAVIVEGKVVDNERVKLGRLEVIPATIEVVGPAEPLPLGEEAGEDTRADWRFLDLRRPENRLIFEVQTVALDAMRAFWVSERFLELQTPKLMGSPSESGAEVFELEYFGRQAFLAQSPQFYKQMAMSAGFERVFEIGPVFRADPSHTGRHSTEFTGVDMEMSWIDDVTDVMEFEERWLEHVLKMVVDSHGEPIERTFGQRPIVPSLPFPKIPLAEARRLLEDGGYKGPPDGDLDGEGMRLLSSRIRAEYDHEFLFLTEYPIEIRPFYHMRVADRPGFTRSFDLLYNGLEITTGAQREHRVEFLTKQAVEKGMSLELVSFYVDFFRYGCPPHGGFGFGLGRFLMALLGVKSLRQVTYLFRGPNRLSP